MLEFKRVVISMIYWITTFYGNIFFITKIGLNHLENLCELMEGLSKNAQQCNRTTEEKKVYSFVIYRYENTTCAVLISQFFAIFIYNGW